MMRFTVWFGSLSCLVTLLKVQGQGCVDGYSYLAHTRRCYCAYDRLNTHEEALATCQADGGTLAMPRDSTTNDFLINLKNAENTNNWFYFGLDRKDGSWTYVDGGALRYTDWGDGEPNNHDGQNEQCANYFPATYRISILRNKWNDEVCSRNVGFICEAGVCCDRNLEVRNGQIIATDNYCSIIRFSCDPGYELIGSSAATCQEDGNWDQDIFTCQRVCCDRAVEVMNGQLNATDGFCSGAVIYFNCDPGYELIGSSAATCREDGSWDRDIPTCQLSVYTRTGGTAVLSCGVTLTGSLTLRTATWRKVGPPVVTVAEYLIGTSTPGPAYTGRASVNDTGFLRLEQVTRDDAGTYRCQAVLSDLSSQPLVKPEVQVVDPPGTPTLSLSPNPVCENQNQDVQLTCNVTSGTAPFTYTFHRGVTQLPDDSSSLTLSDVDRNQAGTYTCTVSNVLGEEHAQTSTGETLVVHYLDAPQLTPSSPVTIVEGSDLSVVCSAASSPDSPTLQWRKGGSDEALGATLRKTPVSRSDAGTYTCTATNACGAQSVSTSAQLVVNVQYPPDGAPTCTVTTSGDNVVLRCELQGGNPVVDLDWTYGGQQAGTSQVSVNQVNAPVIAAGTTYTCTATSVALNPARTCSVTLAGPSVTVSPQPTSTVLLGAASHTLTCTVDSPGVPAASALTWTGPAVTAGRTTGGDLATPSLTISGVQKTDAGDYTCTATNLMGNHSDSLSLVVQYGATDTEVTPATAEEREGDPLTLTCTSDGVPAPTFTWSTLGGSVNGNTVQITSLHRDNGGNFTCTADNRVGDSDSATSSVDVLYLDTPTLNQTSPLTVLEGDSVVISCSAVANPTAGYKWTKQNTSDQWNSNGLTYTRVNRSDEGTYICEASNNIKGTTETKTVTLEIIVNYPPELTVSATPNPVNESQPVSLTCTADSRPDVTSMTWVFVETGETLLQQTTGNSLTYTYSSVSHQHAGVYRCAADNGVTGSPVSMDVTLHVNFVPIFKHNGDKYAVERSQPITLECSAFAYPTRVVYTWMKGGYDITANATSQGGVSTLNITSVQLENYGNYTCTADNGYGQQTTIIQLVEESKPDPPTNLAYTKKTGAGVVTLTWTAGFNGGLETNHTVQYRMEGTTDWVSGPSVEEWGSHNRPFTQTSVFSEKGQYEIRIRAENGKGAVESDVIQILVEENQVLYGTLAINGVDYVEGICEGELSNRIITQLDSIFDSYKGYEGAEAIGCRPGSVLADFEATVAKSEAAAAMDTYIENLSDGQLGEFTVDPENSKISDVKPVVGRGDSTTIIIIAVVVSVVVLIAVVVVVILLVRRHTTLDKPPANTPNSVELEHVADDSNDGYQSLRMLQRQKSDHTYQGLMARRPKNAIPAEYKDVEMSSEFPRNQLAIEEDFGSVHRAEACNISVQQGTTLVAVKPMKDEPPANTPNSVELQPLSDHTYQGLMGPRENEIPPEPTYEDVKMSSEFPRSQLAIKEKLGHGEFGSVHRAEACNISGQQGTTVVAVKTIKAVTSTAAMSAFFKELSLLKVLGTHPNVVSFLGCCTDTEPFYLLLEFVSGGSLQSTLRTSRTQQTYGNLHGGSKSLSSRDLTRFAWDVAKGMSFLSSKKILHRDLATRNVLVSADRTCKVSDFGLSREGDEYERTTKTRLPVRWMAPESLFHRKYTTKTDVWAFGVLLWEIVTLGATPYPGMTKREVMDGVQQGYRMGKPHHCDENLYTLMLSCWSADPAQRPEFRKIQRTLDTLMETEHDYIDLASLDKNTYASLKTATDEKY